MLFTMFARALGLRSSRPRTIRNSSPRPVAPVRAFVPRLTALEDRTVPSTFTVTNLGDGGSGSLRAAVIAANANPDPDTIKFKNGLHGTITLGSALGVTQDLTVTGPGAGKIAVSGGGTTRVFNISGSTTDVSITGLTIANGLASDSTLDGPFGSVTAGGGILNNQSHLALANVTMTGNRAVAGGAAPFAAGGAIANVFGATLTVTHSTFTGNTIGGGAVHAGGAIYTDTGASADIDHSAFTGNRAIGGNSFGGAISTNAGDLVMSQCTFDDNLAEGGPGGGLGAGGAVDVEPVGFFAGAVPTVAIDACEFRGNRAIGGTGAAGGQGGVAIGGAVDIVTDGSEATVSNSLFRDNLARGGDGDGDGGGGQGGGGALDVYVYLGETGTVVTVSDSLFDGNRAQGGAGGAGGVVDGWAFGGAINNASAVLNVRTSVFTDNEARGGDGRSGGPGKVGLGGAIASTPFYDPTAPLPTTDVASGLFVGNRATGGTGSAGGAGGDAVGGGVFSLLGALTVSDSALVANKATGGAGGHGSAGGLGSGGAMRNGLFGLGGTATISDTLILANEAIGGAGGSGGGNGGDGQGGGLATDAGADMTVVNSDVLANRAKGGTAGSGGSAGTGTGGGVFNEGLILLAPSTHVHANHADEFDDCFGCP